MTVLITGANRGLGLALTRELVHRGHTVWGTCRYPGNADALAELKIQAGARVRVVALDVTSSQSIQALSTAFSGPLDLLVNNAGVFPGEANDPFAEVPPEAFQEAFSTNVLGAIEVTRALLPSLQKGVSPTVINVSSAAGSLTRPMDRPAFAYSVSKTALNKWTQCLAREWAGLGIRVVAMSPGWVQTEMGGAQAPDTPELAAREFVSTLETLRPEHHGTFLGRNGQPYPW